MVTTRHQILAFLEKRGPTSATELAYALKLTAANIRHHLRVLQKEGVIVPIHPNQPLGRGRPAMLFGLSEQQKSHNLHHLCAAMLQQMISTSSIVGKNTRLRSIANQMVSDKLPAKTMTLTQRLMHTTKVLNEMFYQASWEAHRASPTIKFSHCPYASLVEQYPELCQMDVYLLEALMQCQIETLSTRERSTSGSTICRFRLRQTSG
ncbi:MAG: transcriptional regulator [Anaerolineales bacterium]